MKLDSLKKLVGRGESEILEFKKSTGQLHAAMETVCAFLNSENGGTVLIGVTDDGKIIGQDVSDKTKRDIGNEIEKIIPYGEIKIDYISLKNEKSVIILSIASGDNKPYVYDDRPFTRKQSTTQRMTREKYEKLLRDSTRQSLNWENLTTSTCRINDLDKKRIREIANMAITRGRLHAEASLASISELLQKFELLNKNQLCNAAVILFCKSEDKQFIQSTVRLARFDGIDKSKFLDRKDLRGNIFDLYENTMRFLQFTLPISGEIIEGTPYRMDVPTIPYKALREGVLNALIHRDYGMIGASIDIAIYDDRIEIDSPGCLPEGIELRALTQKHKSIRRNPIIANVLYVAGMVEQWGRGTLDIINLSKQVQNPIPRFEETIGNFSVIFPFKEPLRQFFTSTLKDQQIQFEALTERQQEIITILRQGPLKRDAIMKKMTKHYSSRTIQKDLNELKKLNFIAQKGGGRSIEWYISRESAIAH